MPKSIFISSTSLDLSDYRQVAIDTCRNLGFEPIAMESFEAMGVGATEGSKRKLKEADLYIGIIARRYGYIEAGHDRSVTEIEFDYAGERGLDRLCFLLDPDCSWPDDAIDHQNADRLAAFKAKVEKSVIRSLFTTVEDFRHKLVQALVNWQEWRAARSGELDALFATLPEDVPTQPETLVGRDELLAEVYGLLDKGKRVLLQGFGGMGKTAIAATIAAQRIRDGKGPVLWLRAGTEDREGLFLAVARPFNAQQNITKETGSANQARVVRLLLQEKGVKLIVLDDVWNSKALNLLLNVNAIPTGLPVLVTSRYRFPGLSRLDVGRLSRPAALALLSHFTSTDWSADEWADALCEALGDHAFAVRMAGLTMALDDLPPAKLLERIGSTPHKLPTPEGSEEEGRASIEELLDASLYTLDAEARALFLAFGAFFTASVTAEMMSIFLEQDQALVEDALNRLQRRGLAERLDDEMRVAEYRIHDLAYSYAKSQIGDGQRHQALDACLEYLERHKQPSPENFVALRAELDNFTSAAHWAMTVGRYADVTRFADWLYRDLALEAFEGFLHLQGYAGLATDLLVQAASAAELLGQRDKQAAYLGNLGSAYRDLGQIKPGMKYYRQSLKIYRDIQDVNGEGVTLGRLGIGYRMLGQPQLAIEHLEQSLAIARRVSNSRQEGINLANLGIAYRLQGRPQDAIRYIQQAMTIVNANDDKRGEAINLGNLGDAYRDLGQWDKAIAYYQQALAIAHDTSDRRGSGINLGRLGDAYREQKQFDYAIEYLEQALAIARETGDKRGEAINLGRLGDAYRDQGQVTLAIEQHNQALAITRQMDDKRGEGFSLLNLGIAYNDLRQYKRAIGFLLSARDIFAALGLKHQVDVADKGLTEARTKRATK